MSELPKVSIVIATMNRAEYLRRMLDKLVEDEYPHREVIVVDGASTDDTVALLESYGDKITRWISEPDDGEYFAYNKALKMASGDLVKIMTDDDMLRPGAIRQAVDFFAANPEVEIVFGQTVWWRERNGVATVVRDDQTMDSSRLTVRHWLRETRRVASPAAFIRQRVFDRIGLLSTEYSCGDMEFWARAAAAGVRMGLMPHVVLDLHLTGQRGMDTKKWALAADMVRLNARYGNAVDVVLCLLRKYVKPMIRNTCSVFGFYPDRIWRKWRERSQPIK